MVVSTAETLKFWEYVNERLQQKQKSMPTHKHTFAHLTVLPQNQKQEVSEGCSVIYMSAVVSL